MADRDSDPPRRRLEGVIPELIKRAVEIGVEKATEAPDTVKQFVHDLKVPKEIAGYILSQVEETKNGLFRVVAKEMRDFLEHANLSGEMQKILTTVQFEVNTTIRFRPNEGKNGEGDGKDESRDASAGIPRPDVKTDLFVKRDARDARDDRGRERRRTRE
jgi:hypothetical protein